MIKKFIDKLLGKTPESKAAAAKLKATPKGKRTEVTKDEHGIDLSLVDERAIKVVQTLSEAGFEAFIATCCSG